MTTTLEAQRELVEAVKEVRVHTSISSEALLTARSGTTKLALTNTLKQLIILSGSWANSFPEYSTKVKQMAATRALMITNVYDRFVKREDQGKGLGLQGHPQGQGHSQPPVPSRCRDADHH